MMQDSRTIVVSPLPYDVTREDVESFFAQHAKVNCIRLPSHVSNRKLFCGTALVEFSCDEDMEKMLKQNMAYAGVDLTQTQEFDVEREKQTAEIGDVQATSRNKSPEEASNPSKGDSTKSADPVKLASEDKKDAPSVEDNKENANDSTNSVADEKGDEEEKKSLEESNEEDEKKGHQKRDSITMIQRSHDLFREHHELGTMLSKEEDSRLFQALLNEPKLALARCEAVDWMLKTVVLAVNYLDRFLWGFKIRTEKPWLAQLTALASLSLAAKIEETYVLFLSDLQVSSF
ncbi:LOW QUALITY PROTEIN: hypothetical protein V2J09_018067 [Rumex salicifolius]